MGAGDSADDGTRMGWFKRRERTDADRAQAAAPPSAAGASDFDLTAGVPPDEYGSWRGDALLHLPLVAAAVAAAPPNLPWVGDLADDGGAEEFPREDLPEFLWVAPAEGDRSGTAWDLTLGDEVRAIVDTDGEPEDFIRDAHVAAPGVDNVVHSDREILEIRLKRPENAEQVMARWISAIVQANDRHARPSP